MDKLQNSMGIKAKQGSFFGKNLSTTQGKFGFLGESFDLRFMLLVSVMNIRWSTGEDMNPSGISNTTSVHQQCFM
jgi:hypothetical protein